MERGSVGPALLAVLAMVGLVVGSALAGRASKVGDEVVTRGVYQLPPDVVDNPYDNPYEVTPDTFVPPPPTTPATAPPAPEEARVLGARVERPTTTTTPPPPPAKPSGVWALVVGIDDYPGSDEDLAAAVADARDVDEALHRYGVPRGHRMVLLGDAAHHDAVVAGLDWIVSKAGPDATAVVFLAGHVRAIGGDQDGDGEVVDEAFVTADGRELFDGEVARRLAGLEARRTWIGVAACYAAGFDDVLAPGRVLTAAAAERDLAYENSALGRSYLVEYMVRRAMIEGRASDSVQSAFRWAADELAEEHPNRVPVMIDESGDAVRLGRMTPARGGGGAKAGTASRGGEPQGESESSPASPSEAGSPSSDEGAGREPEERSTQDCRRRLVVRHCRDS